MHDPIGPTQCCPCDLMCVHFTTSIFSVLWTSGYGCVVDPHSRKCTIAQPYPIPISSSCHKSSAALTCAGVSRVRDLRELGRSVRLSLGTGVSMRLGAAKVEFNYVWPLWAQATDKWVKLWILVWCVRTTSYFLPAAGVIHTYVRRIWKHTHTHARTSSGFTL